MSTASKQAWLAPTFRPPPSMSRLRHHHRDRSSHIERACELHGAKMTGPHLLHKGLTSADLAECCYIDIFEVVIMKQPNLGYADVKLHFAFMHPAGCERRVSLCDYYDLCGHHPRSAIWFTQLIRSNSLEALSNRLLISIFGFSSNAQFCSFIHFFDIF